MALSLRGIRTVAVVTTVVLVTIVVAGCTETSRPRPTPSSSASASAQPSAAADAVTELRIETDALVLRSRSGTEIARFDWFATETDSAVARLTSALGAAPTVTEDGPDLPRSSVFGTHYAWSGFEYVVASIDPDPASGVNKTSAILTARESGAITLSADAGLEVGGSGSALSTCPELGDGPVEVPGEGSVLFRCGGTTTVDSAGGPGGGPKLAYVRADVSSADDRIVSIHGPIYNFGP